MSGRLTGRWNLRLGKGGSGEEENSCFHEVKKKHDVISVKNKTLTTDSVDNIKPRKDLKDVTMHSYCRTYQNFGIEIPLSFEARIVGGMGGTYVCQGDAHSYIGLVVTSGLNLKIPQK